jgi:VWFA-related protein
MNSIANNSQSYWPRAGWTVLAALTLSIIGATNQVFSKRLVALTQQNAKELKVIVSVTDKNRNSVNGLPQSAFTVLSEKVAQNITSFNAQDEPLSIAIIYDLSGMTNDRDQANKQAGKILDALAQFIRSSHESNEYIIIAGLNRAPRRLFERFDNADAAIAALNKLRSWPRPGSAAFMDALHLGMTKVSEGRFAKQAIITVTNDDAGAVWAKHIYSEVTALIKAKEALVYTLYVFREGETSQVDIDSYLGGYGPKETFKDFAAFSGGSQFYASTTRGTTEYLERIAGELRRQYTIGFKPKATPKDGKCYSIKVKLVPAVDGSYRASSLAVRNREIYCP